MRLKLNSYTVRVGSMLAMIFLGLMVLVAVSIEVRRDLNLLNQAQGDSTIWSSAQLDVELTRLKSEILAAKLAEDPDLGSIRLRYDIFYSRVLTVENNQRQTGLAVFEDEAATRAEVKDFLATAQPFIDGPDAVLLGGLDMLLARIEAVQPSLRRYTVRSLNEAVAANGERREGLLSTLQKLAVVTAAMLAALVSLVIVLVQVLERSEARARELGEASSRFSKVIQASLDAIIVTDEVGRVRESNAAALNCFGYTAEDMKQKNVADLLRCIETERDLDMATLSGIGRVRLEGAKQNGEAIPVEAAVQPARLQSSDIYVVFLRDISIRLRAEQALVDARDSAIAAERAKSQFLAMMSHEIRTPLHGLLGSLALLRNTSLSEKQAQHVRNMDASGQVLMGQMQDVLDITKYEAGRMPAHPQTVDLDALVAQVIDVHRDVATTRQNALTWDWTGTPMRLVTTDPYKLNKILSNLVGNAVKFTHGGQIKLTLEATGDKDAPSIRFAVSDSGPGIPEEAQARIFEDFETDPANGPGVIPGTGLGLGIAARMAKVLGGAISLDSKVGLGSTFYLNLPVMAASSTPNPVQPPQGPVPERTILVAEDNEISRAVLRDMLEADGHIVIEARNGAEAATLAAEARYDLILMDIAMPEMDGCTAARLIRDGGESHGATILAVTAHAAPQEIDRFLAAGMDGAVLKPLGIETLRRICRKPDEARGWIAYVEPVTIDAARPAQRRLVDRFVQEMANELACITDETQPQLARLDAAHRLAGAAGALGFSNIASAAIAVHIEIESGAAGTRAIEALSAVAMRVLDRSAPSTVSAAE